MSQLVNRLCTKIVILVKALVATETQYESHSDGYLARQEIFNFCSQGLQQGDPLRNNSFDYIYKY